MTPAQQSAILAIAADYDIEANPYGGEYRCYGEPGTMAVVFADRRMIDVVTGIAATRDAARLIGPPPSAVFADRIPLFRVDSLGHDWVAY